jgi:serine/threonine protein kinase
LVIRPPERYVESAILETEIITNIHKTVLNESHRVKIVEYFSFQENSRKKYLAIVFEKLGKSLYEFIKSNNFGGFDITTNREYTRQMFKGIGYLQDKLGLTHTDYR